MMGPSSRRVLASASVSLLLGVSAAFGGAAHAASAATITIASQSQWTSPESRFEVHVSVAGAPADATIAMFLGTRLLNREELKTTQSQSFTGRHLYDSSIIPLAGAQRDASGNVVIGVNLSDVKPPAEGEELRLHRDGVYPVGLEVDDIDGRPLATKTTYLIRITPTATTARIPVTYVMALTAPTVVRPTGDKVIDPAAVTSWTQALTFLLAHPTTPTTIAASPDFIQAVTGPDTAFPDLARLLTETAALPSVSIASAPLVDADLNALSAAGMTDQISQLVRLGDEALAAALRTKPAPVVFVPHGLNAQTLTSLTAGGIAHFVASTTAIAPGPVAPVGVVRVGSGAASALVAVTNDDVLKVAQVPQSAAELQSFFAGLTIDALAATTPATAPAPLIIELTPAFLTNTDAAERVINALVTAPIVQATPLPALFDRASQSAGTVQHNLAEPAAIDNLGRLARLWSDASQQIAQYQSLVGTDTAAANIADYRQRMIYATAIGLTSDERSKYFEPITQAVPQAIAGLDPLRPETFTLTSRQGDIPITITKRTGPPITVRVVIQPSDKLTFPNGTSQTVTLSVPNTIVRFTIRARTSGQSPLTVRLTSPDGSLELGTARFVVRSTAITGVGLFLTIGALAVLAAWWMRHILRARRTKSLPDTSTQVSLPPGSAK